MIGEGTVNSKKYRMEIGGDLTDRETVKWTRWLANWLAQANPENRSKTEVAVEMRKVSPKFIPREWMLVRAYDAADQGDVSVLNELQALFRTPYDEHDAELSSKYFCKASSEVYSGVGLGGTAFMT